MVVKTLTADEILVNQRTKDITADLIASQTKSFTADLIAGGPIKDFTADAILKALDKTKTFPADLIVVRQRFKTPPADVIVVNQGTQTLDADILIKAALTTPFTVDLMTSLIDNIKSITSDLITIILRSKEIASDLLVKYTTKFITSTANTELANGSGLSFSFGSDGGNSKKIGQKIALNGERIKYLKVKFRHAGAFTGTITCEIRKDDGFPGTLIETSSNTYIESDFGTPLSFDTKIFNFTNQILRTETVRIITILTPTPSSSNMHVLVTLGPPPDMRDIFTHESGNFPNQWTDDSNRDIQGELSLESAQISAPPTFTSGLITYFADKTKTISSDLIAKKSDNIKSLTADVFISTPNVFRNTVQIRPGMKKTVRLLKGVST